MRGDAGWIDPSRLLFSDIQSLRVIRRSAVAGIGCNATILVGQFLQKFDPYSPFNVILLVLSYVFVTLIPVYLGVGMALFGPWPNLRPIAVLLLFALLVGVFTAPFMPELIGFLAINAGGVVMLCVLMSLVGQKLGSPGLAAAFLGIACLGLCQFGVVALERWMVRAAGERWMWRYLLDECVVRIALSGCLVAVLHSLNALWRTRREIDRVLKKIDVSSDLTGPGYTE